MSLIINKLKSYSDFISLGPVQEKEIAKAESILSLNFAPEYNEYVKEFGIAAVNGHEFTGIVSSERLNVVDVTRREWIYNPQVPKSMYVIENAAIDGIIIWQDANGDVFQSSPNIQPKIIASSIVEYLGDEND